MPLIADTLDYLSGTNVYSTLDMKAGYWQIGLHLPLEKSLLLLLTMVFMNF